MARIKAVLNERRLAYLGAVELAEKEHAVTRWTSRYHGSLRCKRCAALGADGDVKLEEVQVFGFVDLNWSILRRYDCTVQNDLDNDSSLTA